MAEICGRTAMRCCEVGLLGSKSQAGPVGNTSTDTSGRARRSFRYARLATASASHHDDCAHVFGEKGHIAGIPTCSKCTAVGARLRYTLINRPHEFVALATQEVEEIIARPEQGTAHCSTTQNGARRQKLVGLPSSHYGSKRAQLEVTYKQSISSSQATGSQAPEGLLPGQTKIGELADVIYFWALGEAYLQHPKLQADMRKVLGRPGNGPLAAGTDSLELRSRVQLLEGPFYEGSYLIGSVNFVNSAAATTADLQGDTVSSSESYWSLESAESYPIPSLEGVLTSNTGRMLMALEGDCPARMMRQGAAKTYRMYQMWGYFQRRMQTQRLSGAPQPAGPGQDNQIDSGTDENAAGTLTLASEAFAAPWQFLETMPSRRRQMRTLEGQSVADRHITSLFGKHEECITTLQAWQQMTFEAKWFGRALFDAEEFVLQTSQLVDNL